MLPIGIRIQQIIKENHGIEVTKLIEILLNEGYHEDNIPVIKYEEGADIASKKFIYIIEYGTGAMHKINTNGNHIYTRSRYHERWYEYNMNGKLIHSHKKSHASGIEEWADYDPDTGKMTHQRFNDGREYWSNVNGDSICEKKATGEIIYR